MKGTTLAALMAIASDLDFAPRAVRLEVEELDQLALPAILHWDLNHFVVLERVAGGAATILDPAGGRRIVPLAKLGRHFTGVALELAPTPAFKPVEARVTIRLSDLWSRLVNYRSALLQLLTLSLLLQLATLAMPFYMQLTIDEAIAQGDLSLMSLLFIGFAAVYALNAVLRGAAILGGADAGAVDLVPAWRQCRPAPVPPAARLFRASQRRRPDVADRLDPADPGAAVAGPRQRRDRRRAGADDAHHHDDHQPGADGSGGRDDRRLYRRRPVHVPGACAGGPPSRSRRARGRGNLPARIDPGHPLDQDARA